MNKSEIAQIRQRIEEELEAMRLGMNGIAAGTARHAFIHARMEHIGACQERLADHIGQSAAQNLVCHLYVKAMESELAHDAIGTYNTSH